MEPEVRKFFWSLHQEVLYLFYRWKIFRQLFASGKENLELLNKSGSNVFALLQCLIEDNIILTLCRLTDPEKTGSNENLSIRNFLGRIDAGVNADVMGDLHSKLANLQTATEKLRIHRSKRIAHLDLSHTFTPELLPILQYSDLQDVLKLLESLMREIHLVIFNADTSYMEPAVAYGCDGEHLFRVLGDARRQNDNNVF